MKTIVSGLQMKYPSIFNTSIMIAISVCLVSTACTLIKLHKENSTGLALAVIVGRISTPIPGEGPIVVAAYSKDQDKRIIAHYSVLHDAGEYELLVEKGNYYIFAYRDKDNDLIYEDGEPAGQYGDPSLIAAPAGGLFTEINFVIPKNGTDIDLPHGFNLSPTTPHQLHSRQAGAILDLDDALFSEENGSKGYWQGLTFFKEIGGNIYFLEPYSPEKIPILFIHGATGTPKGWKYFAENIDRTRFQPWFFYYPSGSRIKGISHLLYWKLVNLKLKYKFDKIYFTAHSLGGLVARSFIMDFGKKFPYVPLFISLSTPWGGDQMAKYGVQQSPVVIPCWNDMQPDSAFIKSLYRKNMPENVSFYMFYGYRGSRNPFRSSNDGTLSMASLLDHRPQSDAKMIFAFNEDHASIIYSPEVLARYNSVINAFDDKYAVDGHRTGGKIRITMPNYSPKVTGASAIFIAYSPKNEQPKTAIYFYPEDNGAVLGPFPSGDYMASIYTPASKPDKAWVPLSIENNKTTALEIPFSPDGTITGSVTSILKPEDHPFGVPYDEYIPPDKKVTLESIVLRGNGIHRVIHPLQGDDVNPLEDLVSRTDFLNEDTFYFFGLPAGEYRLEIKAKDHEPYSLSHRVTPGKHNDLAITDLIPQKQTGF